MRTTAAFSRCGTRLSPRPPSALPAQAPGPAAYAGQPREHQIGGGFDVGAIRVALAGVDQEHLARVDRALVQSIVEVKAANGDDQRDWDRVAVLRHLLPRLEPEPDHAHRPAVCDLLETERPMGPARPNRGHGGYHAARP